MDIIFFKQSFQNHFDSEMSQGKQPVSLQNSYHAGRKRGNIEIKAGANTIISHT